MAVLLAYLLFSSTITVCITAPVLGYGRVK